MAKIIIPAKVESVSAANPYVAADGLVDVSALAKLQTKIAAANKKVLEDIQASAANPAKVKKPKLLTPLFYTSRKPIEKYSASLDKKNDHKYKLLRGQVIRQRARAVDASKPWKGVALLNSLFDGADKVIVAEVKKAISAINAHNKKGEKVVGKVKNEKVKIREESNKVFDASVELLKQQLTGLKPTDIVESTGMMGKTVIIRLGPDNYVAVGKADKSRFAAAVKANKAASNG